MDQNRAAFCGRDVLSISNAEPVWTEQPISVSPKKQPGAPGFHERQV